MQNVGTLFDTCEEELKDFVDNSPFCPNLLKAEFELSQKEVCVKKKEKTAEGDAFDELYAELDVPPVNAPQEEWMDCFSFGVGHENNKDEVYNALNEDGEEYNIHLDKEHLSHDWQIDQKILRLTDSDILEAEGWIKKQKNLSDLALKEPIPVDPSTLNAKQDKAYRYLTTFIDSMKSDPHNTRPIYLNISGRAGCGKTYFINCVSQYAIRTCGPNFLLKAAPTGTAAFLIGGDTLHSTFKLPLITSTRKDLPDLGHDALQELQDHFHNCKILVIDEKSMVGLYMLYAIDKRLREIKCTNSDIPFGGISVILMGDFAQLPPVGDKPLYAAGLGKLSHQQTLGKIVFEEFKRTIIFDTIMRQQGDKQKRFREVLNNVSTGKFTTDDWSYLDERNLMDTSKILESERNEFFNDATMLCAYNKDLIQYNITRIKALGNPIAIIKSMNSDATVASVTATKAHGLPSQIMLAKDCKVILTTNLWREAGLTNGAKGIVKYIVYEPGVKPPKLPCIVIVQFPQYIGPSYLKDYNNCVPIVPRKKDWFTGKKLCWRIMLPLKPAYGTIIHSSQGQSLDRVIINIGDLEFSNGLTYTAISRCKAVEMLSFKPMKSYERFKQIFKPNIFNDRRNQDRKEELEDEKFDE